jgi:hypothetical protein
MLVPHSDQAIEEERSGHEKMMENDRENSHSGAGAGERATGTAKALT